MRKILSIAASLLALLPLPALAATGPNFSVAGGIGARGCTYVAAEPTGGSCNYSITGSGIGTFQGLKLNGLGDITGSVPVTPVMGYSPADSLTNYRETYNYTGTHTQPWMAHTIVVTEDGSGQASGPARAAYGLNVNIKRAGFPSNTNPGEIDGVNVVTRNTIGDTSGFLANVGNVSGTAEGFESSASLFDTSGNQLFQIQAQVGEVFPGGANGFVTFCGVGSCTNGLFAANNGGTFQNFLSLDTDLVHGIHRTFINGDGTENDFGSNSATQDVRLTLGLNRTNSGKTYLDMMGDTTYPNFGLRIIRSAGPNGGTSFITRGIAQTTINAQDTGASVALQVASANLLLVYGSVVAIPAGQLQISEIAAPTATPSAGTQFMYIDSTTHRLTCKKSDGTTLTGC